MALTTGHDSSICFLANSLNCFFVVVLFQTWGGGNLIPSWFLPKCVGFLFVLFFFLTQLVLGGFPIGLND